MTETTNQTVATPITVNADPNVEFKDMKFRFKKDKMGVQRPTVELKLPVPSAEGIVAILGAGGKDLDLLLECVADVIRSVAVGIVGDDEKISQDTFPMVKLGWHAIATAPRAERKTIEDSVWEGFAKDYLEIMPALTGKTTDQIGNAVMVFTKKLNPIKTNKPILSKLKDQFGIWVENTKKGDDFVEIVDLLVGKFDTYLNANEMEQLIANL